MRIMGIHCGRTEILGLVCNHKGRIMNTARIATEAEDGVLSYIQSIHSVVNTLVQTNAGIDAAGIVCSGRIDPQTGLVSRTLIPGFVGTDLRALVTTVPNTTVYVGDSATATLLGERWVGSARGCQKAVLLKLGAETETAVLAEGIVQGVHYAEEWGFNAEGLSSFCLSRQLELALGRSACHEEYQEQFLQNDPRIVDVIRKFSMRLTELIEVIERRERPQLILISGELTTWYPFFSPLLEQKLQEHGVCTRVQIGQLGMDAGCIGAARSCLNGLLKGF